MDRHIMRMSLKAAFGIALMVGLIATGSFDALQQDQPFVIPEGTPVLEQPAVVTTCGQSPGALMVQVICDKIGLQCEELDMITAEELAAAVETVNGETVPKYKTLFVTMGTSLKGMGAAGIDVDFEVARVTAVIEQAHALGMMVVGVQAEGPSRRVDETDEASIQAVTPVSDLLIVREDINWDGYFTDMAEEKGIPLIMIHEALDLELLLPQLFQTQG